MLPKIQTVQELQNALVRYPEERHRLMPNRHLIKTDPSFEFLRDSRPLPNRFMSRLVEEFTRHPQAFGKLIQHCLSTTEGGDT